MISPSFFCKEMERIGVGFYSGVPDSLLKNLCAYISDTFPPKDNIIAVNEGCAIGLATGYHLATGKIPAVYMKNSGMGNSTNPLLSLTDPEVYRIPLVLIIGWRGEPGVHDEPQHVKQGKVTCSLLDTMGIPYVVMSDNEKEFKVQADLCGEHLKNNGSPFAFVVRKNTFSKYELPQSSDGNKMSREQAIEIISERMGDSIFVSTTGMASRELYEIRDRRGQGHGSDFLTVGCMGHASQIALGIALNTDRRIVCIDGDGAALMHMGGMATIAVHSPKNYTHIIINNGAHDSVGGQPTISRDIDVKGIAESMGYRKVYSVSDEGSLGAALSDKEGPVLIEVMVHKGARADLGRPKSTPVENKEALMRTIRGE